MGRKRQPGGGTILERSSKQHGTVYQIRWRVNGGPARYETVGPDRREAEQALSLKLAEINQGTYREHRDDTFRNFASDWFHRHRSLVRPSAAERIRNDLEVHLLPSFGDYLLSQIGVELVERYVAEKRNERRRGDTRLTEAERNLATARERGEPDGAWRHELREARLERGLSDVSVNKTLTLLRQVLEAAVRYGFLDRNPVAGVKRLKVAKRVRPFVQIDQIEPLVEATPAEHRVLLLTLLLAGLRIGEALALRWRDCDLLADPPHLTIARTWDPASKPDGAEHRGLEGPVKNGEEGIVTIGPRLLAALLDQKAASRYSGDDDLVFPTSTGRHGNPSNFRRRVLAPAVERANRELELDGRPTIPTITPHSLRHTYCSLLVAQGEDLSTVAAQMRHADPSTTLRVYTHVMQHRRKGVAERLDMALWGDGALART
jgi:integrase